MHKKIGLLIALYCSSICADVSIIKGLSYDDVLLIPKHSSVSSRKHINTHTHFTKDITLSNPLVSANMDTVTEAPMAIAMAQAGGIGIIHRFNSIEKQVEEVRKVKRYRSAKISSPFTAHPDQSIEHVSGIMAEHDTSSFLIVDEHNTLLGILTARDIRFRPNPHLPIRNFMTPRDQLIVAPADISIEGAKKIIIENRLEKLPLVHQDGTVAGLITSKDIYTKTKFPHASIDKNDQLLVGAAIGVKEDSMDRALALAQAGADVLVIDIAHGDSDLCINTIHNLKQHCPTVQIVAGNVATAHGTRRLIQAGAHAIKVGVGPGSICTTRIVSGSGYPQLSAVIACAQEADKYGIPIIADGGIKNSGDITKAIAAGASTVMLGSLFAGTDESPGTPFIKNGKKYKVIRGMASFVTNLNRKDTKNKKNYVPEGVEAIKPYKGSVQETIGQLLGGLQSGMSYCGVTSIADLRGNGEFVEITHAGMRESRSHDVSEMVR